MLDTPTTDFDSCSSDLSSPVSAPFTSPQWIFHRQHNCALRIWTAEGKRKDAWGLAWATIFLYVEYCAGKNRQAYHCYEFRFGISIQQWLVDVFERQLFADLNVVETQRWQQAESV